MQHSNTFGLRQQLTGSQKTEHRVLMFGFFSFETSLKIEIYAEDIETLRALERLCRLKAFVEILPLETSCFSSIPDFGRCVEAYDSPGAVVAYRPPKVHRDLLPESTGHRSSG